MKIGISTPEVLTSSFLNPRRDEEAGHAHPKPFKLEVVGIRSNNSIRLGHSDNRCRNMVIESTMLIVCDNQGGLVPLRTGPQCLIHLFDKPLAPCHIMRRMVIVCGKHLAIKVPLLNHHIVRQLSPLGVQLEFEAVLVELDKVLEPAEALVEERGRDVLVVDAKGQAVLLEAIKDGLLREAADEVLPAVEGEAVGGR